MELKRMPDQELAARAVNYIERLEELQKDVSSYMNNKKGCNKVEVIREKYKQLKEEIKADAHYLSLARNERFDDSLYNAFFSPSILEAAAYGFSSPTNSRVDQAFYSSVEEAHYKMTKYHSLDRWKAVALSNSNKID